MLDSCRGVFDTAPQAFCCEKASTESREASLRRLRTSAISVVLCVSILITGSLPWSPPKFSSNARPLKRDSIPDPDFLSFFLHYTQDDDENEDELGDDEEEEEEVSS